MGKCQDMSKVENETRSSLERFVMTENELHAHNSGWERWHPVPPVGLVKKVKLKLSPKFLECEGRGVAGGSVAN